MIKRGTGSVIVIIKEYEQHNEPNSNPAISISHSANTLGKGMHPFILPPAIDK